MAENKTLRNSRFNVCPYGVLAIENSNSLFSIFQKSGEGALKITCYIQKTLDISRNTLSTWFSFFKWFIYFMSERYKLVDSNCSKSFPQNVNTDYGRQVFSICLWPLLWKLTTFCFFPVGRKFVAYEICR